MGGWVGHLQYFNAQLARVLRTFTTHRALVGVHVVAKVASQDTSPLLWHAARHAGPPIAEGERTQTARSSREGWLCTRLLSVAPCWDKVCGALSAELPMLPWALPLSLSLQLLHVRLLLPF